MGDLNIKVRFKKYSGGTKTITKEVGVSTRTVGSTTGRTNHAQIWRT